MALHFVGDTLDRHRAHALEQSGELVSLIRGVDADADDDIDAAVVAHAAHIAHYLYPTAYLSSASAVLLAPTPDGRLFISGAHPRPRDRPERGASARLHRTGDHRR